ncbi:MAG: VWA domain-containing protein [Myxococcales bacterium]|nr:VWA domain-containing protein [Myxococcales bacterium]
MTPRSLRTPLLSLALLTVALSGCGASSNRAPASGGYAGPTSYASPPSYAAPSKGYAESAPATASPGGYAGGGYAAGDSAKVAKEPSYAPPPVSAPAPATGPMPTAPKPSMAKSDVATGSPSPTVGAKMPPPPPSTVTVTTKTTVVVTPTPVPVSPEPQDSSSSGVLTAAIWDDNAMRSQFLTFVARYPSYASQWGLDLGRRVTLRVEDKNGVLVGDAPISIRTPSGQIVNLRTHGDGTTYYYPPTASGYYGANQSPLYSVAAQSSTVDVQNALRVEATFAAPGTDVTWTLKLKGVPNRMTQPALDVAFVVDCTGSMGDEIAYLQAEMAGVVTKVKKEQSMRRVRLGLVLYRDRGDDFVTKSFPFTEDLPTFLGSLKTAAAMGGGDMPESVNAALADTVQKLQWAGDETGRLAILVADAPPHFYADEQYTYKNAIVDLSARGIKLVTLGASGIDKTTEYVFRQMSAYTGGRYIFLTDDSGVGESHITPDISGYQVEHLDKILFRVIADEAKAFKR